MTVVIPHAIPSWCECTESHALFVREQQGCAKIVKHFQIPSFLKLTSRLEETRERREIFLNFRIVLVNSNDRRTSDPRLSIPLSADLLPFLDRTPLDGLIILILF